MPTQTPRLLDPWATSSLLQKAIRRSETELACHAARELNRYRGKAVFRRLINIAFEDVGVAAPDLVAETVFLGFNPGARELLGPDIAIIQDLVRRLSEAPKDRSTDYLVCSAIKSAEGQAEQVALSGHSAAELSEVAADPAKPLLTRAAAVLLGCTRDDQMIEQPLSLLLSKLEDQHPGSIYSAVRLAAKRGLGSYIAMAPLLWSAVSQSQTSVVAAQAVPPATRVDGIPLYTFDKHTALGKKAIATFAHQNPRVLQALEQVPPERRRDVAFMAAFYADAVPISRRLMWDQSEKLERLGFAADMGKAGCPSDALYPILNCVRANLPDLDRARLSALTNGDSLEVVQIIAESGDHLVRDRQ